MAREILIQDLADENFGYWFDLLNETLEKDHYDELDLLFIHEFHKVLEDLGGDIEETNPLPDKVYELLEAKNEIFNLARLLFEVSDIQNFTSLQVFNLSWSQARHISIPEGSEEAFEYWKNKMQFYLANMAWNAFEEPRSLDASVQGYSGSCADNLVSWTGILTELRGVYIGSSRKKDIQNGRFSWYSSTKTYHLTKIIHAL